MGLCQCFKRLGNQACYCVPDHPFRWQPTPYYAVVVVVEGDADDLWQLGVVFAGQRPTYLVRFMRTVFFWVISSLRFVCDPIMFIRRGDEHLRTDGMLIKESQPLRMRWEMLILTERCLIRPHPAMIKSAQVGRISSCVYQSPWARVGLAADVRRAAEASGRGKHVRFFHGPDNEPSTRPAHVSYASPPGRTCFMSIHARRDGGIARARRYGVE